MVRKARLAAAIGVVLTAAIGSTVRAEPAAASATSAGGGDGTAGIDAGILLGGARTVAVDLLWLRADLRRSQGYTLELPALYHVIAQLDPKNALAWEYHAEVLLANLPLTAEGDADGGWRFVRQGLQLLQLGLAHNPGHEPLTFQLAMHAARIVSERPGAWRARAADTLGADPLQFAVDQLTPVVQRPNHLPRTAILLKIVLTRLADEADAAGRAADAAGLRARAAALQADLDALGEGAVPTPDHKHEGPGH